MIRPIRTFALAALFALVLPTALRAAARPDDRAALAGLTTVRAIYDVRVTDPEKLLFNLRLLGETLDGLAAQGVKGEIIVAFRGPGVRLLTLPGIDGEVREYLKTLKERGVRFEACAVAMREFKADPARLVPEVALVGNVFASLIGYQNKGYAVVTIN